MSEITKHQQQGVSLRTFSEQTGIREGQLLYYAKKGQIIGARKHPLTRKWWIYPPAKLVLSDGSAYKPRSKAAQAPGRIAPRAAAAAVAVDVAFDVGTSPHGLAAVLPPSVQETRGAAAPPSPAKPVSPDELPDLLAEPEDWDELLVDDLVSPGELPDVFAEPELQEAIRGIKEAAGETHYPLVLSGPQMKLMERAITLAIEDVIEAMNEELDAEAARLEIKPDLDAYNQIWLALRAAKAAYKRPRTETERMGL